MTDLVYKDFEKYEQTPSNFARTNNYHHFFIFPNGYGASVIKSIYSYGGNQDLFELAVLKKDQSGEYDLCYTTEITDDVIGYLKNDEVLDLLERIKNL